MGVDLSNEKGKIFCANWQGWRKLLNTAVDHGWEPKGTLDMEGWGIERGLAYTSNDGHLVSADDSGAIADALEAAAKKADCADCEWAAFVRQFVKFCRQGAFRIW